MYVCMYVCGEVGYKKNIYYIKRFSWVEYRLVVRRTLIRMIRKSCNHGRLDQALLCRGINVSEIRYWPVDIVG